MVIFFDGISNQIPEWLENWVHFFLLYNFQLGIWRMNSMIEFQEATDAIHFLLFDVMRFLV